MLARQPGHGEVGVSLSARGEAGRAGGGRGEAGEGRKSRKEGRGRGRAEGGCGVRVPPAGGSGPGGEGMGKKGVGGGDGGGVIRNLTAVQRRLAEPAVQVAGLAAGLPEGQVVLVVRRHPGGAEHGSQVQA